MSADGIPFEYDPRSEDGNNIFFRKWGGEALAGTMACSCVFWRYTNSKDRPMPPPSTIAQTEELMRPHVSSKCSVAWRNNIIIMAKWLPHENMQTHIIYIRWMTKQMNRYCYLGIKGTYQPHTTIYCQYEEILYLSTSVTEHVVLCFHIHLTVEACLQRLVVFKWSNVIFDIFWVISRI